MSFNPPTGQLFVRRGGVLKNLVVPSFPAAPLLSDPRGVTTPFHGRWRGPHNTGLSNPEALTTAVPGRIISANGTYENLDFTTGISIAAAATNVILRNCRILAHDSNYALDSTLLPSTASLLLEDCVIDGGRLSGAIALASGPWIARRCLIIGAADGVRLSTNCLLEDSYVSRQHYSFGAHADVLQTLGGTNIKVRRCGLVGRLDDPSRSYSSVLQVNIGTHTGFELIDNYIDGGGYTITGMNQAGMTGAIVSGNRWGRNHIYGVYNGGPPTGNQGNHSANNVFDDTGLGVI